MQNHNPFRYFKTSPEIIRLAVMMYVRFPSSLRNVEDLLHERGIDICHETVRYWWNKFGSMFAREIRRKRMWVQKWPCMCWLIISSVSSTSSVSVRWSRQWRRHKLPSTSIYAHISAQTANTGPKTAKWRSNLENQEIWRKNAISPESEPQRKF